MLQQHDMIMQLLTAFEQIFFACIATEHINPYALIKHCQQLWLVHGVLLPGHDDDVTCLALHPSRSLVATGQVASALDGTANCPFLHVWDTTSNPPASVQQIDFPTGGIMKL
jgi:hypothetical protein